VTRRILLVEDEPGMALMVRDRLVSAGYEVELAGDGVIGRDRALTRAYDLILLDLLLPDLGGLEVCRELRSHGVATPILMLTALGDVVDKVVGLRTGADDYLTKPFETAELFARIEALLRRTHPPAVASVPDPFRFGNVEVRFREVEVLKDGNEVHLTPKMFELLHLFIQRRGETLRRGEILDAVWGLESNPSERTVDVHVAWLRQRLEVRPDRPQFLRTVRGFGYRFAV